MNRRRALSCQSIIGNQGGHGYGGYGKFAAGTTSAAAQAMRYRVCNTACPRSRTPTGPHRFTVHPESCKYWLGPAATYRGLPLPTDRCIIPHLPCLCRAPVVESLASCLAPTFRSLLIPRRTSIPFLVGKAQSGAPISCRRRRAANNTTSPHSLTVPHPRGPNVIKNMNFCLI